MIWLEIHDFSSCHSISLLSDAEAWSSCATCQWSACHFISSL